MKLSDWVETQYRKNIQACSDREIYRALWAMMRDRSAPDVSAKGGKQLYYLSAEFLVGKMLTENLRRLGMYDSVKEELSQNGKDIASIEAMEREPALGNGGLGRLAACFLDAIADLGLNGVGVGLLYRFGLFRQIFAEGRQTEQPDPWLGEEGAIIRTDTVYPVSFPFGTVYARRYEMPIFGEDGGQTTLHLFDLESTDESIVREGILFDKGALAKNLTLFLYPDDSDDAGRMLRLYQQYFLVSAAAQLIVDEVSDKGGDLAHLPDYAVIQINDTHPSLIIPELIRLLTLRGLSMDDAVSAVERSVAYTNHTILAEALEKWQILAVKTAIPHLVPIIEVLDDRVRRRFADENVAIIDRGDTLHMARMDIHYSKSINGVASLHTEILKSETLAPFYAIYPEKFNNKTNGISFSRWLYGCNRPLTELISSLIGDGFRKDSTQLEKLWDYREDASVIDRLIAIKGEKKRALADWLKEEQGVVIDPDSLFDIQIKRLHEYKRQQLNALGVIHQYVEIKEGKLPRTPVTVIFGAKAAPAYGAAKDIIHLILCLARLCEEDPQVSPHLRVVMVENYNVSAAERLIPACDLSQQISLASKEASGTGNMKLMLNGAVTIGTEDGANVEIHRLVGDENIYIFGDSSATVVERYKAGTYRPREYYESDPRIHRAVDFITSGALTALGDPEILGRVRDNLLGKDYFMTFPDFDGYLRTRERGWEDYRDRSAWGRKMLRNIAMAGYFSSHRTILEYNREIWKL